MLKPLAVTDHGELLRGICRSKTINFIVAQNPYRLSTSFLPAGTSADEAGIDRLCKQAQEAIPRLFNQITLFDDPLALQGVDEAGNDDIRVVGPELVLERNFDHIDFNQVPDQRDLDGHSAFTF